MFGGPEEGKASGVAFSIAKAQAFFLYPTPPVPKSQRAEFLDFPFPAQSCFKAGYVGPTLLPEGPGWLQQLKGGDAGDIDWDGNDGPWQPMLFQGATDHVAISAEQEESRDVSCALGTVLDHLHVEAVIVNRIVRDDHCPTAVLLHHSGLGEEGAAPSLHQSDLVLDEETVAELPAGLRRFCRDKVNLLIPCVLEDI